MRNREDNKHASYRSVDENQYLHFSHRDATAGRELFPRWLRDNSGSTTVRGKKTSQNQSMVSVPKYRGFEEYAESVEEEMFLLPRMWSLLPADAELTSSQVGRCCCSCVAGFHIW